MAGYTRQSSAQIYNGADITAPPLNAEFNKLEDTFDGSTGHSHNGAAGQGPKINLATSVSGYLRPEHGGIGGKNNFTATSNPTTSNDATEGYAVGCLWENVTSGRVFICVGNFSGSAVWRELVQVNGTAQAIIPETNDTIDLGTVTNRFQDLWLSGGIGAQGNVSVNGTFTLTGAATLNSAVSANTLSVVGVSTLPTVTIGQVTGSVGTVNGVGVGDTNPQPITGTTIVSNSGFTGDLLGNVSGDLTSTGTSSFNNISVAGALTGAVTGDVSGNITSAGTSTFNNVTISGTLNMDGATTATIQNLSDPTNLQDAATKNYVDTGIADLVAAAPAALDTLNELAEALGDDANFSTTMTNALAGKVADTGDTMTGDLIMSGATVTGLPLPANPSEATSKQYVDTRDSAQVSKTGDTMSGNLGMGTHRVTNLGVPQSNTDATTKQYVDGILGSSTAASTSASAAATSAANALTSEQNASASATSAAVANANAQQFMDTYFVSATEPTGTNITVGDLWFDITNNIMKVYGTGGWTIAGSGINGTSNRINYTVGTVSGAYNGSATVFPVSYDVGFIDVWLNGVKLSPSDFISANGTSITLAHAAGSGDLVSAIAFGNFNVANTYTQAEVDNLIDGAIDDTETLALIGL